MIVWRPFVLTLTSTLVLSACGDDSTPAVDSSGSSGVWSATSFNGASAGTACANWTSTAGSGLWGQADATDGTWTSWCSGGVCDWLSPIYCVQQ